MKTNTIITIGRQYGSAGRQIGRVLAEELGIKCYDKVTGTCSKGKWTLRRTF